LLGSNRPVSLPSTISGVRDQPRLLPSQMNGTC
jgi:hypothetical protein